MARILCTWELGGNYGHFAQLLPVARFLAESHEVLFALPRDFDAGPWLAGTSIGTLEAPSRSRPIAGTPRPVCYADILRGYGFDDPGRLEKLLAPRETLLCQVRPDAVLVNSAPIASLAARRLGIPRFVIGYGFEIPPATSPMPAFAPAAASAVLRDESLVVRAVNSLLPRSRAIECAFELARGDQTFLATCPELDHYGPRVGEPYAGPLYDADSGRALEWPIGEPGVLIYLRHDTHGLDALFEAIADEAVPALAHIPGADDALRVRASRAGVALSNAPIRMRDALGRARLMVCQGGHGTVSAALLAGVPLLLFPQHVEQLLTARNVVKRLRAGAAVGPADTAAEIAGKLSACLRDPGLLFAAARFRDTHAAGNGGFSAHTIADSIWAVI